MILVILGYQFIYRLSRFFAWTRGDVIGKAIFLLLPANHFLPVKRENNFSMLA
jgi:hypothetical protein